MTRNKKKLRRLERLAGAAKTRGRGSAARTLAVTGVLLGGLMLAPAYAEPWNGTSDVDRGNIVYVPESVTVSGNVTVKGAVHGTVDAEATAADTWTGGLSMGAGSTLTITNEQSGSADTAQVQVNGLAISGGTLAIGGAGDTPSRWDDGPMLVSGLGGANSTIADTTITLGDYGQLVQNEKVDVNGSLQGGLMTITGGSLDMAGSASEKAAILRACGGTVPATMASRLVLNGTALTVNSGKYGVVLSHDTALTGGSLTVDGNLVVAGTANKGTLLNAAAMTTAKTDAFSVSNGVLSVGQHGTLSFGGTLTLDNTQTTVGGRVFGAENGNLGGDWSGDLRVKGGTLTINGLADNDGRVQFDDIAIADATLNIGAADGVSITSWDLGPMLVSANGTGTGNLSIANSTVNLGDYAQVVAGKNNGQSLDLTVTNSTVHLGGSDASKASILRASAIHSDNAAAGNKPARLVLSDSTVTVDAGRYGVILSRDTDMSGGKLLVDGTLLVAGAAQKSGAIDSVVAVSGAAAPTEAWGEFRTNGATITVGSAGTLDFASGNVNLTVAGNSAVTADLLTVDTAAGAMGLSAQKLTLAGGTVNVKALEVGSVANSLSMTGGSLVVAETFQNGSNDAVAVSGGVLSVDKAQVYDASNSGSLLKSGVNTIAVSGNGVVEVRNGGEMEKTVAQIFHDNLVGRGGLWTGVTVTGIASTETTLADGSKANTVTADDAAIMSTEQLAQTTVATNMTSDTTATLGSAAGQVALVPAGRTLGGNVTLTTAAASTIVGQGEGSSLVIGAGDKKTNVTIADGAALNLGVASTQGGGVLNGNISNSSGKASTLNVANGAFAVNGDVDLGYGDGGTLNLNENAALAVDGYVAADTLNLTGATLRAGTGVAFTDATVAQGGTLVADTLFMTTSGSAGSLAINDGAVHATDLIVDPATASTSTITVGSEGGRGELVAETANLNGATLFLDPVWSNGGTSAATNVAIDSFAGGAIDGNLGVGRNSMLALGTSDKTRLASAIDNSGLSWSEQGVTAALGIFAPQTLGGYDLVVDGSLTTTPAFAGNRVEFAAQSLLVVDGEGLGGDPALRGDGSSAATVDASSKLLLTNAFTGETYAILSDFAAISNGWTDDNLLSSSYLQQLKGDSSVNGQWSVSVNHRSALATLPGISAGMAGLVDSVYLSGLNDVDSPSAGVRFVTRATDRVFTPLSESARALESAAQTALAGGAPSVAFDAVSAATGAVAERTGISVPSFSRQAGMAAGDAGHSFSVWAMPLFRSTEIDGQKAGSFKYGVDSDLWGGAIGADVTNEGAWGRFRLGVALNVGGGDAKSTGDLYKTRNDFDFWGATAYAGWRLNNFGLSGDLGYSSVSSDIKQDQPWNLGGRITSKVDADVYSAGLKAEYVIPTPYADITPSLGMRYSAYRQGRHNADNAWGTVFAMDKADMDIWTFPIGVKLSRDFTTTGWSIRPELNLAIIPAAGDTRLDSKASIPGLNLTPAGLSGHVFDDWTGEAGLGLSVAKENVSFGLNYGFQGSENRTSHSVFGTLRVAF